jgi:hypothetical protein
MPFLALLIVACQVFFAVHAVRTGKQMIWLWIIIFFPGLGCLVYFITQYAPEAANSRSVRKARNTLIRAVDPQREMRRRMERLEMSNTVENRMALADECMEAKMYPEAIELLDGSLTGIHATDPGILQRLALAQFESGETKQTLQTLDKLISANPSYKSPDSHLLYARALEAEGRDEDATKEYEVLRSSYPGEEARVRYGLLLLRCGTPEQAKELFRESLMHARQAPKYYRNKEREWLRIAEREGRAAEGGS